MTVLSRVTDVRPGMDLRRLARLCHEAVERCALDLNGARVLTEAATGPYVVTPVLAALAGADVVALTRATRYGSVAEVNGWTSALAVEVGVEDRMTVTTERTEALFAVADVITNSGHLRPIVDRYAAAIRADAVVTLMFEAWEIQAGRLDLDLDGLRARGVRMAGTNERHPAVDVFSYLGPVAVAQLADAGISAYGGTIAVLCDNPFRDYLADGLRRAGAQVRIGETVEQISEGPAPDAVIVALTPSGGWVVSPSDLVAIGSRWPTTALVQYWGDVDRGACEAAGLRCWPVDPPGAGHMAVLPSRVGPEPIIRLQAGGLKVAEVLRKPASDRTAADLEYIDELV